MPQAIRSISLSQWILRIGLGIIFIYHGATKLFLAPAAMAGFFQSIGLPGAFSTVVGILELLGGLALITGIGAQIAAAILAVILVGAIFKVKLALGFVTPEGMPGWEFDFALLAASLSIAVDGVKPAAVATKESTNPPSETVKSAPVVPATAPTPAPQSAPAPAEEKGPRIAVIYYSSTGNTHKMAEAVAAGAREAGAEVRLRQVEELAPESAINQNPAWKAHHEQTKGAERAQLSDLEWADGIIMGSPTRFGTIASQLKQFMDTTGGLWFQGKLVNKIVAGFVTASNPHGGQEATVLSLYASFYHWGGIVVPPGFTDEVIFKAGGNPYGASGTGTESGLTAEELTGARYLGKRIATVSARVAAGRAVTV